MTVRFRIAIKTERDNALVALANAGYKVWVTEEDIPFSYRKAEYLNVEVDDPDEKIYEAVMRANKEKE